MTRRHRVAAEWVPEGPPEWAACQGDKFGGWLRVLQAAGYVPIAVRGVFAAGRYRWMAL